MIFIRQVLSYSIGIAMLANLHAAQAKSPTVDSACQTYFCMLDAKASQVATCQPLVAEMFNTFPEGSHTVTCGSHSADIPAMNIVHRKAGKDFCRPDLRFKENKEDKCKAEEVIDFSLKGVLYTRQWKLKEGEPITEYYRGTSSPTYTP